jgi:hypothetical protein
MVTIPVGGLSTAATHQPPTGPTTPHAQQQTTVPSCTSIETSLVQGVALIPRNHRRYERSRRLLAGISRCKSCRLAGLDFATAERGLHDQAETGNPRNVSEFIVTGDEVIEFRLHGETHAGAIGVGGEVFNKL